MQNFPLRFSSAVCFWLFFTAGTALKAQAPDATSPEALSSAGTLPPLSADRPGFTTSADVLSRGILQIETGLYLQVQTSQSVTTRSLLLATPLLRMGLFEGVELRFGGSGYVRQSAAAADGRLRLSGMSDHSVGAKIGLLREQKWVPELTLIPTVSLPIGCRALTSSGHDPNLMVAAGKALPHSFSATANFMMASLTDARGRFTQDAWSLSAAHPVARGIIGSLEVYRIRHPFRDGDSFSMMGLGLARVVGRNVQFDLQAGHSLEPSVPAWFFGAGFVWRHPISGMYRPQK